MTPWEARESYLESILSKKEIETLTANGMYQRYTYGEIPIDEIYAQLREQGV